MGDSVAPRSINPSFALDSETAHTILSSALDAHILMNQSGTIVGWNPQSERIFGWTSGEVLGRRLSEIIIPPAYREAHERGIRTFQETGQGAVLGKRVEIEGLHRDQHQFPIELTVTSVKTPGGLVFSAFVRDITARKQAEQSLKEAKERAEQAARDRAGILAAVDVFFIYVDCHGLVTEWTAMAEQTFSLLRTIVLGRRLTELPIPWNWDEVVGLMKGPGGRRKVCLPQSDGTERLIGMTVTSIQQGEGTGYIFMGKDITEQVKLDHDVAQSQKLESIGQLAAGIAHEINTPTQFVGDNTMFLNESFIDVLRVLHQYQTLLETLKSGTCSPALIEACETAIVQTDLNYLLSEIPQAIFQSLEGIARVSTIVQAMKEFAHPGAGEKVAVNLNNAIKSTVTVASNEWKYVAELRTNLDESCLRCPVWWESSTRSC
jgi:PAS domain S-box-containing protein